MGLRAKVATLLDRSGALGLATRAPLPFLRIVGYHRIGDPKVCARETDEGVVDITAEGFERHVAFLAERFEVVGIEALRRYFVEGVALPKNAAVITFDDGYRECFDVGFPVLRRFGVPGVFFVSTEHVTRRRAFWWDRIAYLVKKSTKATARIDYPEVATLDLANGRAHAIDAALSIVKRTFGLDVERFLEGLARALDVPWSDADERRLADATLMTWDHLREMKRAGMDIESHSATHRVLSTLSPKELEDELVGSKRAIEAELDAPICSIAYPNGGGVGRDTPIGRAVQAAGYDLGFAGGGICRLDKAPDPFDIRRISVDIDAPQAYWRACVVLPPYGRPLRL